MRPSALRRLFVTLPLFTLALCAACSGGSGPSLAVNLRTDYVPNVEFDEVRIFLSDGSGSEQVQTYTARDVDYVAGQRVGNFEGLATGDYRIRAELLNQEGRIIGERSLAFSLSQATSSTLVITRSCAGVVCPDASDASATECSGGRCVNPECGPESPEACGEGCTESSECLGSAPCAEGVCTAEGSCIFMPLESGCDAGEFCNSTIGCLPIPERTDAGARDAGAIDSGEGDSEVPFDGGMDAGDDAGLPPSCDAPCDTGNVCEEGVFDCSSGVPVCTAVGAGNAGATCRESAGACDVAETCDGSSTECPADGKRAAGTVCNPAAGACDVPESCDGDSSACPLDEFQPVGTTCPGGFCDETNTCSDSCTPGAACTPTNICRTGTISCAGGVPSCVASGNVPNGTTCQATEFGAYGSCGGFSGTCDETGTQSRSVNDYTCQSGSCTLATSSESRACTRDTDGGSCGSMSFGSWSSCGGFADSCDESGNRSRSVTTPTCAAASCDGVMTTQNETCTRSTDGDACGAVTYGSWGTCGGFANICDTTGTQSRDVNTPTCGSSSCATVTTSESRACTRSTDGTSCGTVTYGSWGACGGFANTCDTTGTQSRDVNTPTCGSSSCGTVTTSESRACTRSTDGTSCGTVTYGSWGACGGFSSSCDTTGTRSRDVYTPTCSGSSCGSTTTTETGSCTRSTNGDSCGTVTYGAWGACGGFTSACDTTGTRSRSVFTPTCSGSSCGTVTTTENGSCTRSTNGDSCGTVTYGPWGACGGFANACDTTGTRSRSVFTPTCSGSSCGTVTTSESGSCTRTTDGTSCGTVTYGAWSACGGFTSTCDNTGTRSREVYTPTCGSGSCGTVTTTQNGSCTRTTTGNNCDSFSTCQLGTCNSSGTCVYSGPTCNFPNRCCEPGICIPNTSGCP